MKKIKNIEIVGTATFKKPCNLTIRILADEILGFHIAGVQQDVYYSFGQLAYESFFDTFDISIKKSKVNRKQIETILKSEFNVSAIKIKFEDGSLEIYNPSAGCYEPEVDVFNDVVEIRIETVY